MFCGFRQRGARLRKTTPRHAAKNHKTILPEESDEEMRIEHRIRQLTETSNVERDPKSSSFNVERCALNVRRLFCIRVVQLSFLILITVIPYEQVKNAFNRYTGLGIYVTRAFDVDESSSLISLSPRRGA